MKKYVVIILLFSLSVKGQNVNSQIKNLVNTKLVDFLEKIPNGQENLYGFNDRTDFLNCKAGNPIQVLSLDINNVLIKQNVWRVPVILNNEYKILFTVINKSNKLEIVDIGGVKLAKELEKHHKNKPLSLLRIYKAHIDFISNSSGNLDNYLFKPLESSLQFILNQSNNTQKTYTINEVKSLINR